MVLSINDSCKPSIKDPINICTDTPMAMPIAIRAVCPLLDLRNLVAMLNANFKFIQLPCLNL